MTAAPSPKKKSKKWIVRERDMARAGQLASTLGVSPIVGHLLIARGYDQAESARSFLKPTLNQLHAPSLMRGMSDAVARLVQPIDRQEPILIYVDCAVD